MQLLVILLVPVLLMHQWLVSLFFSETLFMHSGKSLKNSSIFSQQFIYVHDVLTFLTPPPSHLWFLSPTQVNPPSTVSWFISSPGDAGQWPLKSSELPGCWQMHRYYTCNKYFVNKLTTFSLHQKSFINNNIVNKIKCMYWFNYKIVIGSQN